jgi:hypothetical protein
MENLERRTRVARLKVAAPEAVYAEMREYALAVQAQPYIEGSDELELMLSRRENPLIDLALAGFASNQDLVGKLYADGRKLGDPEQADHARGLRLAVLSNQTVAAKDLLSRFPERVIGDDEVAHVLKEADWKEAEALVLNPTVSDDVLKAIYRGDKLLEGIDETRRRELVVCSSSNTRLGTNTDDEHGPDMGHWEIHKAIFEMLETVPTSNHWAGSLTYFLRRLDPNLVKSPDSIDEALDRWTRDETGEVQDLNKGDAYTNTGLTQRQELRCLIGALYGRSYKKHVRVHGTAEDEDVARRCAFYGNGKLDVKDIDAGYKRDNVVFVFAAIFNDDMLLNRKTRLHFEEECLNSSDTYLYEMRCQQLHRRRRSFDPRPTADWMVDDETEREHFATERQVSQIQASVKELQKLVSYAPWFFAALAILISWKVS